jgi:hypothetical protein
MDAINLHMHTYCIYYLLSRHKADMFFLAQAKMMAKQ